MSVPMSMPKHRRTVVSIKILWPYPPDWYLLFPHDANQSTSPITPITPLQLGAIALLALCAHLAGGVLPFRAHARLVSCSRA
eukprot:CAMPEP_0184699720 /NCGR_PEP_ID=MMETSP0313-20130426/5881_1 /TAXON_ID=2792 /ORGANISM="Porphyridium aerugineum, Strain SAG 1380-2" /LENGTH=81 /DNA_ID=CAMNT_0027158843 /DNA_START=396 /DNA_END=641 /DNA_ORIENTATION=+